MALRKTANRLVTKVLDFAAAYSERQFSDARENVEAGGSGSERTVRLLDALRALERLAEVEEGAPRRVRRTRDAENVELPLSAETEVEAILRDEQYLASKDDLSAVAARIFRLDLNRSLGKLTRPSIVQKLIARFNASSDKEKLRIYTALRRGYLRTLGSSLAGWSGLIGSKD